MTRRPIFLCLLIVGSILSFSVFTLLAAPGKTIPSDEVNPKLETVLQELSRTARAQPLAVQQFAKDKGIPVADDLVTVIVEPVSGRVSSIDQAAVRALGGEVEAASERLMRVRVPISRLETLADQVNGIAFIRLPYRPRPMAVTSEGVALTGADDFHTAGYYGQGTKVAVIDLGFVGYTEVRNAGELASVVSTHDYTGSGFEASYDHGTAVAEIVEDMAPLADLYLLKISDEVDLEIAVAYCISNGVHIINHSVGWYNTNFYDGTGTIGDMVETARANDILWVNAAGNEAADGHWQGEFVDYDSDSYLDFGTGEDFLDTDGIDEGSRIYATAGDTVHIYMTWDDWDYAPGFGSNQDYELYLYDSFGGIVYSSDNLQNGTQEPTEEISYDVQATGNYEIVVYNWSASSNPDIEIFVYRQSGNDTDLEHHIAESSITTPANSAKALAVGAISRTQWTTGEQQDYSSQGPSNNSKYATSTIKPDICGPDGVSTYTYNPVGFGGTSAAAPHVAGAAALLLSKDPGLTAAQLQSALQADAIDMGAAGKDNIYGSGRLNLVPTPTSGTAAVFRVDKSGNVYADNAYYGAGFHTGSADIAEWVPVSELVEPGDVLELDPENAGHYRKSRGPCSTLVAGVVSTDPGFVLGTNPSTLDSGLWTNDSRLPTDDSGLMTHDSRVATEDSGFLTPDSGLSTSDYGPWTDDSRLPIDDSGLMTHDSRVATEDSGLLTPDSGLPTRDYALLALIGIVPMKATDEGGPIEPGDLLTSSSTPGYAMKWNREDGTACTLLAKALEALDSGTGVIQVLLMR